MKAAYAFVLLLAGCGGSDYHPADDNHGYGYSYDAQGASGLRLRVEPGAGPTSTANDYEAIYAELQSCVGITAPQPFVIVVTSRSLDPAAGLYKPGPPLILLTDVVFFRHEAIHYLLDHSTDNPDRTHSSPLFARCS